MPERCLGASRGAKKHVGEFSTLSRVSGKAEEPGTPLWRWRGDWGIQRGRNGTRGA